MKDFDSWNKIKKKVDLKNRPPVKLGKVYWCSFGVNVGVEQDGDSDKFQRLVIVIKKFSNQIVLVAPLTTKIHMGDWYLDIIILNKKSQIILNQIKPIDTKGLNREIGQISEEKTKEIIKNYFELINN